MMIQLFYLSGYYYNNSKEQAKKKKIRRNLFRLAKTAGVGSSRRPKMTAYY